MTDDEAAVDALIAQQPTNVAALIRKADLRAGAGDDRVATAFYRRALKVAAREEIPIGLDRDLARAEAACERASRRFEEYLEAALSAVGLGFGSRPPRFQEAIDILVGRRQADMGLQWPRALYYPGLPQRRYYDRREFPWAADLERLTDIIREEAVSLAAEESRFAPYLVSDPARPPRQFHGLIDNPNWTTLPLWENGGPVAENVERCPHTFSALKLLDLAHMSARAPWVVFSKLKPGARIPRHTGPVNTRLICHLPLVVPEGCGFSVGGETRSWVEGELMIFDDTFVHEAWNDGAGDRIVLIFDVWHPELNAEERRAVTAIFAAIDAYSG